MLLIAIGAVMTPPVVALTLGNSLSAVWASPGLYAFVLVAVCAARFPVDRTETRRLTAGVLALTVIAVLLAPAHAYYRNGHPFSEGRNYYSLATAEVMKRWRQASSSPLKTVSGDKLAMALGFYSPDHPAFVIPFTMLSLILMRSSSISSFSRSFGDLRAFRHGLPRSSSHRLRRVEIPGLAAQLSSLMTRRAAVPTERCPVKTFL